MMPATDRRLRRRDARDAGRSVGRRKASRSPIVGVDEPTNRLQGIINGE